ncbi:MAG TPA: acyl-CoA dehydrogenase family protein [Caulobacteraceae bacterium]|jgi:hypothetical protein
MIDWCAGVLDIGELGVAESSMAKVSVSEALFRVADRCVQVMGGTGVTGDTIVEQVFREIRTFRIYDGPTEVPKATWPATSPPELRSSGAASAGSDRRRWSVHRRSRLGPRTQLCRSYRAEAPASAHRPVRAFAARQRRGR